MHVRALAAFVAAGILVASPLVAEDGRVRVHLTAGNGAALSESVADLRAVLGERPLDLVDDAENADVIVRVTARSRRDHPLRGGAPMWMMASTGRPTTETAHVLDVRVEAGGYGTNLTGEGLCWRAAARQLGGRLEQWLQRNESNLFTARALIAGETPAPAAIATAINH